MSEDKRMITATELKKNLGKYLDYVSSNHEIVVTKNGEPSVRISPFINDIMHYMMLREEAPKYDIGARMVSYEEFLMISEQSEGRMEYIDGEIIMQTSPSSFHQEVVGNLYFLLKLFLKGKKCKVFLAPFDVTLYKDKEKLKTPDVIQPDILIACDARHTIDEQGRYQGTPSVVIEVLSPSTRSTDMTKKLNTFMLGGCSEYLMIDPIKERIYQYGFKDREIECYETYNNTGELKSYVFDDLVIKIEEVFE